MKRPSLTVLEAVLILLVFIVWLSVLIQSVVKETQMEYCLDNTGQPVKIHFRR